MAPIFFPRAGQEIESTDDSLFDDLFVADSFEPSKLSDWMNRRADIDSRSDPEDSDGESVDSDGAESVDSIDSDDDFDNAQVTASQTTAASTSSISAPPPPSTSTATLTTSSPIPPVTASESSSAVPPVITSEYSTATTRGTASTNTSSRRASSASTETASSTGNSRTSSTGAIGSTTGTPSSPSSPSSSSDAPNPSTSATGSLSGVRAAGGIHPNVIAGVIVSIFFAIVLILMLLAYRRFRINRARRTTVPFPVEFVNPPPQSRFILSSIIPKRVKTRHASPSMVSRPAPASWVEFPGGASMYGRDSA
ncbi:hypothetical protein DFH06DRAFT_1332081 [Mycena polygramma]|nr:hypothetical protein DFH06DRAFT_1332081 [Mycena polygramma]